MHRLSSFLLLVSGYFALAFAGLLQRSCINKDCSALRVSFDNPPINLFNAPSISEINAFLTSLRGTNTSTKVVVFSSSVPGFFGSHLDLHLLDGSTNSSAINSTAVLDQYYDNIELLVSLPTIFIAEVNGRTWGCGDEHLLRMDMRFAGPDAQFSAPEASLGVLHVGGLQQLVQLVGPGLAAEYMLSSAQVDAQEAARIG
ncbi:putative enoyl-CoA hydratase 2, mitochondrial [Fulvia fulva]|uniref:Enoyl-CoA hydratase 2, mitochondrial n=1 Tax=Passalora fulva TaxID=5499 RepID=A0A9Q8LEL2_PASFU|nr:putative enoyl-CoA hydratase 2, mitochondrial [Fulvia fulva]KAK4629068.1 putative enoyl-CoA hydratase 2, mitochondrial [Fulvia fulva]KAK4630228.1 putative enoyl-CoA hydratase 2, mitochondrial [Fulvia fulva]UJO15263.1 putative enoyl-CoA hydratase 2, mitochondrial [Fulvia fulva]WPV12606.1 putative enoyl-CoA hydratase 2, mitochondrial [Fulvia fulva]WPV27845.1 putative enoyl-CoA hydratase 2, mitochondrial [Fulvia fulva]